MGAQDRIAKKQRSLQRPAVLIALILGVVGAQTVGVGVWPWTDLTPVISGPLPVALADTAAPQQGRPAPGFAIPAIGGGQVILAQYAGHPRVVTFFSVGCIDCRPDLAALEQAYRRYRRQGLVVLGIGVYDTAEYVRGLAKLVGATFPIGYDEGGDLAARPYRLSMVPTAVFVDAHGIIRGVHEGRVTDAVLSKYLALILPVAPPAQ